MIFYRVTYLMKPQHIVVVFDRKKSQTSYLKSKYQPTTDILRISLKQKTCDMPEYHNIFMALKTFDKLEVSKVLAMQKWL